MRHEPLLHAPHDEPFRTLPRKRSGILQSGSGTGTGAGGIHPGRPVLAMAYVPMQVLNTLYDPEEGFCQGTIFPELNKPWLVGGVNCG